MRGSLFGGKLTHQQVEGMEIIIDKADGLDTRWVAYMLATAFHETGQTMQPIKEYGTDEYFRQRYDITGKKPKLAQQLGNINPGDGVRFCGRGFVQLTGRRNYEQFSVLTGVDLIGNPELACATHIAAIIMLEGMTNGLYTGRKLADYFSATRTDWIGARRIINGLDKAVTIAGYAKKIYQALT